MKTALPLRFHLALVGLLTGLPLLAMPVPEMGGVRAVQPRSDHVVTAWLGYLSSDDPEVLGDPSHYTLKSASDPAFAEGRTPVAISRFSRAGRSANASADWRVLMDHFMHLRFDQPFLPGHRYYLEVDPAVLPRDLPRTGHFRLDATPNPSFKLNQLGYTNVSDLKHIYLSSYLGDGAPVDLSDLKSFRLVDAQTGDVVFRGPVDWVADEDRQGADTLYRLDISGFEQPGWFYAEIPGFGVSYTFQNGPQVARELFSVATNGLYLQRAGTALVPPWGGDWVRPISHHQLYIPRENVVHPWDLTVDPEDPAAGVYYDPEGPRPIRGGHHDAGDYDTRLTHLALPEKLMTLYEGRPGRFTDGMSFIPEAGNGVPDILDEVAWSLLHYAMLQDYFEAAHGEFGAVPSGMESSKHPPVIPVTGDGDPLDYWMRKATPYSSFSAAAVFGQAARVFEKWDSAKATEFLYRARAAYAWALAHRGVPWEPENPKVMPLNWEDDYDAGNLAAAQAWAAAQLFVTTGEEQFWADFERNADEATTTTQGHLWSAVFPVFFHDHAHAESATAKQWREAFLAAADADLALLRENAAEGYATLARNTGDWGKANPIANVEKIGRAHV